MKRYRVVIGVEFDVESDIEAAGMATFLADTVDGLYTPDGLGSTKAEITGLYDMKQVWKRGREIPYAHILKEAADGADH